MLAHAFFPQIPQGLLPVVIKEGENLLQVLVFKRVDVLSQLFQSEPSLGFTMRMVEDIHELSNDVSEALHKPGVLAFQRGKRLLFLQREIGWLLEEAQRNFHNVFARSMTCSSWCASPWALMFL